MNLRKGKAEAFPFLLTHPGLLRSPAPLFKKERGAANSRPQIVGVLCNVELLNKHCKEGLFIPSLF
jgi:hypothetical protein